MVEAQPIGLEIFLREYPNMRVIPSRDNVDTLNGEFDFTAAPANLPNITDSYYLNIAIPSRFPSEVPLVTEIDKKIPRDGRHHVNPDDTLCLGSPLRLLWKLNRRPSFSGFAEECLVPYLYGMSHKLMYGIFPFGELAHGKSGIIADYFDLFGLRDKTQVFDAFARLSNKKRVANKQPCPCGCGKRLGACRYHLKLAEIRKLAARSWFRQHRVDICAGV